MNKIKIILILMLTILLTGCVNKDLLKVYEKMQAGENMNGYSIDLRIYGKLNDKSVNKIIKITNYKDEDFLIREINTNIDINKDESEEENNNLKNIETDEYLTYVVEDKIYRLNDQKYEEVDSYSYTNPLIYLEGLKNTIRKPIEKEELLGEQPYKIYEARIKKNFLNKILDEIGVSEEAKENEVAKIYVNSEGYLYRIIYEINDLTVNVNYYGINTASEVILPN